MTYTLEDFPVGTVVEVRGGETYTVTDSRPSSEADESQFVVYLNGGHPSVIPNWEGTNFRRIMSTPRTQDDKSKIVPGDRVRVKPILPGMSGSTDGDVVEVTEVLYKIMFSGSTTPRIIAQSSGSFSVEKIERTWQQKLDALPVRSILEGKNAQAGRFAVKMDETFWAISGWSRMTDLMFENEFELPND